MSDNIATASAAPAPGADDVYVGRITGKVLRVEPAKSGEGVKVVALSGKGREMHGYFANKSEAPEVGTEYPFAMFRRPSGLPSFRKTVTSADEFADELE